MGRRIHRMQLPIVIILVVLMMSMISCKHDYTPKPRGYFRIAFPHKAYHQMNMDLPYTFKVPDYSSISKDSDSQAKPYWINVDVPGNKASIHISYKTIKGNLAQYTEESRMLAYKHAQKASAIDEKLYINRAKKVYGTVYNIKGNVASPMQFYLTDSTHHFIRGALYIREIPNIDSLQPVINFLEQDVLQLVESTEWKDVK